MYYKFLSVFSFNWSSNLFETFACLILFNAKIEFLMEFLPFILAGLPKAQKQQMLNESGKKVSFIILMSLLITFVLVSDGVL